MWKSIEIGVRRCLTLRHRIYQNPADIIGTHPDILAAIEARDADRACTILGIHIAEAGQHLLASWAQLQAEIEDGGQIAPPVALDEVDQERTIST